jgi:hypothetical protein
LVENPEGKRRLGEHKRKWENNIKVELRKIGFGMWIGFIWHRIWTICGLL